MSARIRGHRWWALWVAALTGVLVLTPVPPGARGASACGASWVRSWNASLAPWTGGNVPPIVLWNPGMANIPTLQSQILDLSDRTLRMPVRMRVGGQELRLHFSNRYGSDPLVLGPIEIAPTRRAVDEPVGAVVQESGRRPVLFDGAKTITIPPGGAAVSDEVPLEVAAGQDISVSVYVGSRPGLVTEHPDARQTSFLSTRGDHTTDVAGAAFVTPLYSWYYLSGIDVLAPRAVSVVATLGDSITDGTGTSLDAHHRWPDALQRRLNTAGGTRLMAVANAGLGGNSLTTSMPGALIVGEPGPTRFPWDVAALAGVTDVIVALGTNDLGFSLPPNPDAASLIAAYQRLGAMIREHGLRGLLATMLPANLPSHGSPIANGVRDQVNRWIREHGAEHYTGVIDFAQVLADPSDPQRLDPRYDGGDGIHPNDAGAMLMARAVDLAALSGSPCLTTRH